MQVGKEGAACIGGLGEVAARMTTIEKRCWRKFV